MTLTLVAGLASALPLYWWGLDEPWTASSSTPLAPRFEHADCWRGDLPPGERSKTSTATTDGSRVTAGFLSWPDQIVARLADRFRRMAENTKIDP
jgi:hypothetical protein